MDFGSDQPLDPPKILLSEEIAKNFSFETAEAQAEKNHTSIPFASGDHLQDVLRSLLADDAVTIDDLICFVNNPYAEGSILDSVGDHIQHYWEQCGCSLTLDSEERKFVETAIVARIRKLSTARQGGQLSRLDKLKEYADQCTQPDSEITKEARQALVYNRVYGLLYQIDALSQAQEDSYPYKKEKQ